MTPPFVNPPGEEPSGAPIDDGADDQLLAAFVGPNWNEHYRESFAAIRTGAASLGDTFNWAAALAPLWLAYRGLWILQLGSCIALLVLGLAANGLLEEALMMSGVEGAALVPLAIAYIVVGAAQGLGGDRLLYRRAAAAISRARSKGHDRDASLLTTRKAGGVSLAGVVLVPVGFCALLFWWSGGFHHHDYRDKAYLAAMKSDLRNLVTAQESYFADFVTYTPTPEDSVPSPYNSIGPHRFTASSGVTITVGVATATGWNATARHNGIAKTCGIFVGDAPSPMEGASEGEPKCR